MSELVHWHDANLPPADVKRLAELEALAKEHSFRFYTLEVSPARTISVSYHSNTIFSKRIQGEGGVPFELVLDLALAEMKAHILGQTTINAKP